MHSVIWSTPHHNTLKLRDLSNHIIGVYDWLLSTDPHTLRTQAQQSSISREFVAFSFSWTWIALLFLFFWSFLLDSCKIWYLKLGCLLVSRSYLLAAARWLHSLFLHSPRSDFNLRSQIGQVYSWSLSLVVVVVEVVVASSYLGNRAHTRHILPTVHHCSILYVYN